VQAFSRSSPASAQAVIQVNFRLRVSRLTSLVAVPSFAIEPPFDNRGKDALFIILPNSLYQNNDHHTTLRGESGFPVWLFVKSSSFLPKIG
jgi:hypothetical protein